LLDGGNWTNLFLSNSHVIQTVREFHFSVIFLYVDFSAIASFKN
jgi:hypothetical protein